jgi:hypothetical protein
MYVYMYTCMYVYMYVRMYVHMYVFMYVCVFVCIYGFIVHFTLNFIPALKQSYAKTDLPLNYSPDANLSNANPQPFHAGTLTPKIST